MCSNKSYKTIGKNDALILYKFSIIKIEENFDWIFSLVLSNLVNKKWLSGWCYSLHMLKKSSGY